VEAEDEILLVRGDVAALDVRTEVVHPTKAAALAASEEAGSFRQAAPPAFALRHYVPHQKLVLLCRPWPLLQLPLMIINSAVRLVHRRPLAASAALFSTHLASSCC